MEKQGHGKLLLISIQDKKIGFEDNFDYLSFDNFYKSYNKRNYDAKIIYEDEDMKIDNIIGYKYICIVSSQNNINEIISLTNTIKKVSKKTFIILMGRGYLNFCDELLKECENIDYVILGNSYYEFEKFLKKLDENNMLSNNKIINDTIYTLPIANEDPYRCYYIVHNEIAYIVTSEGCTANCSFCTEKAVNKLWNGRNIKKVVSDIKIIYNEKKVDKFMILDSSFEDPGDLGIDRINEFCNLIIESKLNIAFYCLMRTDSFKKSITNELISLLKKAGCISIYLGVESGNNEDLLLYNKKANTKDNFNAMHLLSENNLNFFIGFIMINPYSTKDKLKHNFKLLHKFNIDDLFCYISILGLYNKTSIYKKVENDKLLNAYNYKNGIGYYAKSIEVNDIILFLNDIHSSELFEKSQEYYNTITYFLFEIKINNNEILRTYINYLRKEVFCLINNYFEILYINEDLKTCITNFEKFSKKMLEKYLEVQQIKYKYFKNKIKNKSKP